jgi:hypothetical protein
MTYAPIARSGQVHNCSVVDIFKLVGGLSVEETAEVFKISTQSVLRDWKVARAWFDARDEETGHCARRVQRPQRRGAARFKSKTRPYLV